MRPAKSHHHYYHQQRRRHSSRRAFYPLPFPPSFPPRVTLPRPTLSNSRVLSFPPFHLPPTLARPLESTIDSCNYPYLRHESNACLCIRVHGYLTDTEMMYTQIRRARNPHVCGRTPAQNRSSGTIHGSGIERRLLNYHFRVKNS